MKNIKLHQNLVQLIFIKLKANLLNGESIRDWERWRSLIKNTFMAIVTFVGLW